MKKKESLNVARGKMCVLFKNHSLRDLAMIDYNSFNMKLITITASCNGKM